MSNFVKWYIILVAGLSLGSGYFLGVNFGVRGLDEIPTEKSPTLAEPKISLNKTFVFDNFHGQDLGSAGFELEYPISWNNNGQYFSSRKVTYYDISSTDAPMYYDLISEALIDSSDLKYQITSGKKNAPDSEVTIDGKVFKKYDFMDSQIEDNRIIVYIGPKISIFGAGYYLVFRFEEKPLGIAYNGNDPELFEKIVKSLKFKQ